MSKRRDLKRGNLRKFINVFGMNTKQLSNNKKHEDTLMKIREFFS